jgi:hypothetical protein
MWFYRRQKNRQTKSGDTISPDTLNDNAYDPLEAPRFSQNRSRSTRDTPLNLSIIIILALSVGAAGGVTLWYWLTKTPKVSSPHREELIKGNKSSTKEAEAEAINNAIANKPAELRQDLSKYVEVSEDIKQILSQGLEAKNIGGAVAVVATNLQKNHGSQIDSPEQLGFRRIDNDKSLVNLALMNKVDIQSVSVSSVGEHHFKVIIKAQNNTPLPLEYVIPKGQLIEIKEAQNAPPVQAMKTIYNTAEHPQTVAKAEGEKGKGGMTVIPPWEPATIEFIAYCANPDLPAPNGPANLTIYTLDNTSYTTWKDLRDLRSKNLNLSSRTSYGKRT